MDAGYGINRKLVMHNDFIIVGPSADPAKIKGTTSAIDALKKMADARLTSTAGAITRAPINWKNPCGPSSASR